MFGFIEAAAKGTVNAVASVAKTAVGTASSVVPGGSTLIKAGGLVAAPLPLIATGFAKKNPLKAAAIVATAGTAGGAISAGVAQGGDKWLPAASAAKKIVDAAKGPPSAKATAAKKALLVTKLRAAKGDRASQRSLDLARAANQALAFDASGRMLVVRWYLYRDGTVTRAV